MAAISWYFVVFINLASKYFVIHDLPFRGVFYHLTFNHYTNISEGAPWQ